MKIDLSTKAGQRIWDAGAVSGGLGEDVVTPLAMTIPVEYDDGTKGEETLAFSYSRQGLVQFLHATPDDVLFDPATLITKWDQQNEDGLPAPINRDMPLRLFGRMMRAIEQDARRRWPWMVTDHAAPRGEEV
jgi:hypothetical protein